MTISPAPAAGSGLGSGSGGGGGGGNGIVIEDAKTVDRQVYEQLRGQIIAGMFRPGERLVELRLAQEIGISRAPVREALRRLEQEGLVINRPRYGPFVRQFSGQDVGDLYHVRVALETLAIDHLVAGDHAAVADSLDLIVRGLVDAGAARDLDRFAELEIRFHEALCARSGNNVLQQLYHTLSAQVRMVIALENAPRDDLDRIARLHAPIAAAIRAGDAARAKALLRDHILKPLPELVARVTAAVQ